MKFASDITRVPFGRTDAFIGANDAPSHELSYGHDLQGPPLHIVSKFGPFFCMANRDRIIEKTMVGFGRTEASVPQFCSFFRDLQDGHGFRPIGAQ